MGIPFAFLSGVRYSALPYEAQNSSESLIANDNSFFSVEGGSMVEYGFDDGDTLFVSLSSNCSVDEFCVFTTNDWGEEKGIYIKKLIRINNNCYFFEGNPSGKQTSDSRHKGCIPKEKITSQNPVTSNYTKGKAFYNSEYAKSHSIALPIPTE